MGALQWQVEGQTIEVEIERKKRKTLRFEAMNGQRLHVTCPVRCSHAQVLEVLALHQTRVMTLLEGWRPPMEEPALDKAQWKAWWAAAQARMEAAMAACSAETGLCPTYVRVKQQQSIWGSCTRKRGINLNIRLLYCPEEVLRYVVIHELCHLRHPNHGRDFWALVERFDPAMKQHRAWLRKHGREVLRMPLGLPFHPPA